MNRVDEVLSKAGIADLAIKSAKDKVGDDPEALWRHFVTIGKVTEKDVFTALAKVNRMEYVELHGRDIPAEALGMIPADFARAERLIPLEARGEKLFIGTPNPDNFRAIDEISAMSFKTIVTVVVSPSQLQEALDRYLRADEEIGKLSEEIEQAAGGEDTEEELSDDDDQSPIVRFVNLLITQAIQDRASDIHVEPGERELIVRYRIDGVLHQVQQADKSIQKGVVSRLKVMSDIDIGERRKPQDGRMSIKYNGKTIDIRVVTLPTSWGEKVVMRILDHSNEKRSVSSIQMTPRNEAIFSAAISKPHGMVLVTGPTGSGKALPLNTLIPTPEGFTTMGEINVGDEIFGSDGKVYSVTSTSEIDDYAEMYEVTFSDGQKVVADADHQWVVSTANTRAAKSAKKRKAAEKYIDSHKTLTKLAYMSLEFSADCGSRTSSEILNLVEKSGIHQYSSTREIEQALHMVNVVSVDGVRPVDKYSEKMIHISEYPIEDALMGLALRMREQNAVIENSETAVMRFTTSEMLENGLTKLSFNNNSASYQTFNYAVPMNKSINLPIQGFDVEPYLAGAWFAGNDEILDEKEANILESLLKNHKNNNNSVSQRYISLNYLRGSRNQRLEVLQGIVDAKMRDSQAITFNNNNGNVELTFDNNSQNNEKILAESVLSLLRSLGFKSSFKNHEFDKISESSSIVIEFSTDETISRSSDKLNKKVKKLFNKNDVDNKWNYITNIEKLGVEPAKCISVDSPDFTYLVGDGFITTSNSTTIYTALGEVSKPTVNVVTVEDPVEKKIAGISQMQINNKAGMTFSNALRSILRADPDIVFLGEIRDEETAKIAVDASMTGHLVLSTLHTNGAPEAAARLSEMGVEPYLVGSSVTCVVAQRLARKLCNDCKTPIDNDPALFNKVGFPYSDAKLFKPNGCTICSHTGYKGRVALTEVLEITEDLEPLIIAQRSATDIRREAEKHGFVGLREDGWVKVADGLTTIEEVLRVAA